MVEQMVKKLRFNTLLALPQQKLYARAAKLLVDRHMVEHFIANLVAGTLVSNSWRGRGPAATCERRVTAMTAANASRQAPPATMTIFGAAGDLTKRLVVPALYNLVRAGSASRQIFDHWRRPVAPSDDRDLAPKLDPAKCRTWCRAAGASFRRNRSISGPGTGSQAACAIFGATLPIPEPTASSSRSWRNRIANERRAMPYSISPPLTASSAR